LTAELASQWRAASTRLGSASLDEPDAGRAECGGFVVIAVNVDHAYADAEHFPEAHIPRFRIVRDPDGLLKEKFGVTSIPTSFLIDRSGRNSVAARGISAQGP
jgi:hypothetical protein